jgi:osmotically-inducible protein OsmY
MTRPTPDAPDPTWRAVASSEYLAEHIRTALATDRRVLELGLEVTVMGDTIVLRGAVSTPAQRDAAGEVARELAPAAEILNDVEVSPNAEPDSAEEIG